ncbi:MAG: FG-GAP-like repeat-containing protein [Verrucomicrobiae bacterium]|nr:FG-GAP-like repeat-containing protein [Verrucomicrobiae bacterium]
MNNPLIRHGAFCIAVALGWLAAICQSRAGNIALPTWRHHSSKTGNLPVPNGGKQQTACVVADFDGDGKADVIIAERTQAPAIVLLRQTPKGWEKLVVDDSHQRPEAGGVAHDVDGDGDLDLIIGGDGRSDELWWYENPKPNFDAKTPWKRHFIKKGGGKGHHDQVVADFKGTGKPQLMFWNQGARKLFIAEIPDNPRTAESWPLVEILDTSQVKTAIKQEGMSAFDVDGDGKTDLLAGLYWFKHQGGNKFKPVQIAEHPGRIAAGHFKPGKTAQIVMAPGDGHGPLWFIECNGDPTDPKAWSRRRLLERDVFSGHTLEVADINGDGHLDIFCAEMHTPGPKDKCTAWILYGDGRGNFTVQELSVGICNHDSRVADVNGDGRLDIVTKPYTADTPRWDLWLNVGTPKTRAATLRRDASGPLRVHPKNPRYFADGNGKAVYLTGSHTWNNFKDMGPTDPPPRFDYDAYLDFLQKHNHNFIRLWTWELTKFDYDGRISYAEHFPWPRTGPGTALDGKPKFDLSKFDAAYFDRLRERVEAAARRGIYVAVMLFEGHGLRESRPPCRWDGHPFNAANNINGINGDPDGDGRGIEVHTLQVPAVTAVQEAYVRKVIETLNDLDNVLYEIANEAGAYSTEWQYHFIRFIHAEEKRLRKQHPVGMTFQYAREPQLRGTNTVLFASPAKWISPNPAGGYRDNPPAADGTKVILNDTDHLWGIGGNAAWVWKSFLRGLNPIFMDPYTRVETKDPDGKKRLTWTDYLSGEPKPDPKWDSVRRAMGQTRRFAERMNLAAATPQNHLASSGYCLAHPGEFLVYLPAGGSVTVDLSASPGQFAVEWFDPTQDKSINAEKTEGGALRTFTAPFEAPAVLYLKRQP